MFGSLARSQTPGRQNARSKVQVTSEGVHCHNNPSTEVEGLEVRLTQEDFRDNDLIELSDAEFDSLQSLRHTRAEVEIPRLVFAEPELAWRKEPHQVEDVTFAFFAKPHSSEVS